MNRFNNLLFRRPVKPQLRSVIRTCSAFLILQVIHSVQVDAQTITNDKSAVRNYFGAYLEILGHNSFGFLREYETGLASANIGYCYRLNKIPCNVFISAGWGAFKTSSYNRGFSKTYVHFMPLEIAVQIGGRGHFFEIGSGITPTYGDQLFRYYKTGPGGPAPEVLITRSNVTQYFLRIGYSYMGPKGLLLRCSYTPHFYSAELNQYEDYRNFVKPIWIPVGLSVGWTFGLGKEK